VARFAIKVIWLDGEEEYLKEGSNVARFANRERAEAQRDFMKEGMEDEVQSINVVPYPAQREARP
jgi:hypothetical protein